MKSSIFSFWVLALAFSSHSAQASLPKEISGGFGTIGLLGHGDATLDFGSGGTAVSVSGAYYFFNMSDLIMIGPSLGLSSLPGLTSFYALASGRLNLTKPFESAIYFAPSLGMRLGTGGGQFVFDLSFGKRFDLLKNKNLTYTPQAGIYKVGSNGVRFRIQLVNFSYAFN